mgnify:FL=1
MAPPSTLDSSLNDANSVPIPSLGGLNLDEIDLNKGFESLWSENGNNSDENGNSSNNGDVVGGLNPFLTSSDALPLPPSGLKSLLDDVAVASANSGGGNAINDGNVNMSGGTHTSNTQNSIFGGLGGGGIGSIW